MLQISLRSGGAAVLVALVMLVRGELDARYWAGLAVGALFALEFVLVAEGLRHTSASHMVVFCTPHRSFCRDGPAVAVTQRAHATDSVAGYCPGVWRVGGGFWDVRAPPGGTTQADMLWGDFLGLLAGAAWGATTVLVRCTRLTSAPPTQTLLYQLVAAFVVLLTVAWFSNQMYWVPSAHL